MELTVGEVIAVRSPCPAGLLSLNIIKDVLVTSTHDISDLAKIQKVTLLFDQGLLT